MTLPLAVKDVWRPLPKLVFTNTTTGEGEKGYICELVVLSSYKYMKVLTIDVEV